MSDAEEDDLDLEDKLKSMADAQYVVVTKATEFAHLGALSDPVPDEESDEEMDIQEIKMICIIDDIRAAQDPERKAACIRELQRAGEELVRIATKDFGAQMSKAWVPSAKMDEAGQKKCKLP